MYKIKKVLFFRDFKGFSGGHLKVWHYFNHFNHEKYTPCISFSQDSLWDTSNPWLPIKSKVLSPLDKRDPDIIFLAGLDWLRKDEIKNYSDTTPIINLIQHVRHSHPDTALYSFLQNKAIRICVSEQVTKAITQTGQVNGPIYTIPNGIDLQQLPLPIPFKDRTIDILIAGLKQNQLAQHLYDSLEPLNKRIVVLTKKIPQTDYLTLVSQAKIAVFLPHFEEGFFLPALEAMFMETLVVCPDCIGNRSFCLPEYNCLLPQYTFDDVLNAINTALSLPENVKQQLLSNAKLTASKHSLVAERKEFYDILNNLSDIW